MPGFAKKMFALLSPDERRQLYGLLAAMVVLAVIEVASVGSIMPFMTAVSNPDVILVNEWGRSVYEYSRFESMNAFLLFFGVAVLFILVLSNVGTALITWWILRFSWMKNHTIAKRLFRNYLSEPYVFFLGRNTAELEKNILDEVQLVINGILYSLLMILKNTVVIFFVFFFLVAMNPLLAVTVSAVLGGAYLVLFYFSSRLLKRIGWERAQANIHRFKYVQEAFGGIKVLRVLGRESYFLNQFSKHSRLVSQKFALKAAVAQLPKYALEIITFGGVLLIILYFLASGKDVKQVVPVLSLYAFAAYRLMPAMQTVFNKAANIRYIIPSLDVIFRDMTCIHSVESIADLEPDSEAHSIDELGDIAFRDVTFVYPGRAEQVIEKLNLNVQANTTVGFAGATGSGKTTIIDLLLGLLVPTAGEIQVGDRIINDSNRASWQKRIGYVPQDIYLTDDSVANNIAFGIDALDVDKDAVVRAAQLADIHHFIEALPDGYETIVGECGARLSGGQKQRIGIARALYHDPDVLILDEATSALDGNTEETIMKAINGLAHKKTIVIIAHRLSTLRGCDRIFVLDRGCIIDDGKYDELIESCSNFSEMSENET